MNAHPSNHVFLGAAHDENARRTRIVIAITLTLMVAEIGGGWMFGSMALLADGWHMATDAGSLAIAAGAYAFARRHQDDPRFSFGTGKIGDLAAFASAVVLAVVALLLAVESIGRIFAPVEVMFGEALVVAVLGLAANLAGAFILLDGGGHGHPHFHDHHHDAAGHRHHGHEPPAHGRDAPKPGFLARFRQTAGSGDNNLRAAYLHVLADAATSVTAIAGLAIGGLFGLVWIDPAIGLFGAAMIGLWSLRLMKETGAILVDAVPDRGLLETVRRRLEAAGGSVVDLHLWRLGPGHNALVAAVETDRPDAYEACSARIGDLPGLSHVTIEVRPR